MSGKSWGMIEYDPNILYKTLKVQIKNINQQNQVNRKSMILKQVLSSQAVKLELYC